MINTSTHVAQKVLNFSCTRQPPLWVVPHDFHFCNSYQTKFEAVSGTNISKNTTLTLQSPDNLLIKTLMRPIAWHVYIYETEWLSNWKNPWQRTSTAWLKPSSVFFKLPRFIRPRYSIEIASTLIVCLYSPLLPHSIFLPVITRTYFFLLFLFILYDMKTVDPFLTKKIWLYNYLCNNKMFRSFIYVVPA